MSTKKRYNKTVYGPNESYAFVSNKKKSDFYPGARVFKNMKDAKKAGFF